MSAIEGDILASGGQGLPVPKAQVKGFMQRVASLLDRFKYSSGTQAFGGRRDYYESFGWPQQISADDIWSMYRRGGVAARIVNALPDSIWGRPPQLYVKDNPAWNAAWDDFAKDKDLWAVMYRLEVMMNLGRFAALVIGTGDANLAAPMRKGRTRIEVTFLQPYAEKDIRIKSWVVDPSDPRFGLPLLYTVYPNAKSRQDAMIRGVDGIAPQRMPFDVHYSRIIHVVRQPLENTIYSTPILEDVWNYLIDLIKVVGASSESYWLTAFPGLHANVDKELELADDDEDNLSAEIDEYMHSMRRFMRTRGVEVKAIDSKVADPRGAFDVLLTLISGTKGIPKRILLGSEAGQLASVQDKGAWAERIEEARARHAVPYMIVPLLRWLAEYTPMMNIQADPVQVPPVPNGNTTDVIAPNLQVPTQTTGVVSGPVKVNDIKILWPEAYRQSPLERGQTSAQTARTLANIQKGLQPIEETPGVPDIVDPATGQVTTKGTPPTYGEALLSRDEARQLLGLSTDQQLLTESPDSQP